jgi:hypothetical protein
VVAAPSGPYRADHNIQREVDDIDAVVRETGAHDVFALSAGALITLTAVTLPALRRIAHYEPPLVLENDRRPMVWVSRYEKELAQGNLAGGMVSGMKGIADSGDYFTVLPRFVLVNLMRLAIYADRRSLKSDDASLESLIRSLHYDLQKVAEMMGTLETFRGVNAKVLLLGGSRSPAYFAPILSALSDVLPQSQRIALRGVGHMAADDVGKPERVANGTAILL